VDPASGLHLASIQIMNDSAFDVDSFVTDRVGQASRAQAAASISGTGSSQPLGILPAITAKGSGAVGTGGWFTPTAATPGYQIGTSTTATELVTGAVAFKDVLAMITYVDPAYRDAGNCSWVMNDTTMQAMRSVASNTGFPLWQPSVQVGGTNADRLYGYPVVIDQNVSLTASTALARSSVRSIAMVARTVEGWLLRLVSGMPTSFRLGSSVTCGSTFARTTCAP
jgi:HK97 family phage major capsid protein